MSEMAPGHGIPPDELGVVVACAVVEWPVSRNTNGAVVEVLNYTSRNPPSSSDPEIQGQSLGLALAASSWNTRMANHTSHGIAGSLDSQADMDAIERMFPGHQQHRRLLEPPLYHKGFFTHTQAASLRVSSASPVTFIHTPATHDQHAENDAPIE
jgi:hypothetical protein